MSEKFQKFAKALDDLIQKGESLLLAMQYECYGEEYFARYKEKLGEEEFQKILKALPNFGSEYQTWYSEAQSFIKQVLPERLADFKSYYEYPRERKEINFQNYMIRDFLQGLRVTSESNFMDPVVVGKSDAIPEFQQQLSIIKAARKNLDSTLIDIKGILQADLFDSEVDSANALARSGHLRATGVVCGVVIEKHLRQVCDTHNITIRKKKPTISDLSNPLKDNEVIDLAQWRHIGLLSDIRNLCSHDREREPNEEDINDLLSGTNKILKNVF